MVEVNHTHSCFVSLRKYILGWTLGSRKSHQTIVNMMAEYFILFYTKHSEEISVFLVQLTLFGSR